MQTSPADRSWRECESLSVAQTAAVFGRSTHWVRDRIVTRHLEVATRVPKTMVTTQSVSELLDVTSPRQPTLTLIRGGRI